MNRFTKLTLAFALLLSVASGISLAQQANDPPAPTDEQVMAQMDDAPEADYRDGKHGGRHGSRHGGRHGKHMRLIDMNADGIINDDEAAALADGQFMRMDQNRDGSLTEVEFTTPPHGHRGGWFSWGNSEEAAAVLKIRKDKFTATDTDKNASLSKGEFFADAKAKLASADTDKDGKVTPWEFRALN